MERNLNTTVLHGNHSLPVLGNDSFLHGQLGDLTHTEHFARLKSALPFVLLLLCISTLISNSIVLAAFLKNQHLRTPFNVYLISLLMADFSQAIFDLPFTALSEFIPIWPLGRIGCSFSLYAKWVFSAAVRNTHSVISLNRIWALYMPIWYKQYHTKAVAIWLCLGSWVYVHIFLLPGLVMDDLTYRLDDGTCQVNTTAQRDWALPTQIVLYNSSVIVACTTYPLIWLKVRQQIKIGLRRANREVKSDLVTRGFSNTSKLSCVDQICKVAVVEKAFYFTVELQREGTSKVECYALGHMSQDMDTHSDRIVESLTGQRPSPRSAQNFAVLTYLVIGVAFCWTPIMVFFTMQIVTGYNNYLHFIVGSFLYYLNSLLDPIFFTMAITPLRATIFNMIWHRREA
ncbi:hypothetical protein BV898_00530 [Hypsibius exemplaris]|uniref:G-protein coupled receptors family 1 profile domain-containing protein n=1 Tax=Hypsibius exemplaris TaxID=2072580 RepID=A0A1W0XDN5_HYPEX|nr:hypothetical protein BV898_00530 [Hypsibius exemplaris]